MEFNTALYNYLSGYAGIAALVSTRIYPDTLPQNPTYPAIVYEQSGEEEVETLHTPTQNLIAPIYQFDLMGSSRASADAVAKQLRLAFKNYSGTMGGVGGVEVSGVDKLSRIGFAEKDSDGKIINYRTTMDFQIWYQE